jgi:hypothetical protein
MKTSEGFLRCTTATGTDRHPKHYWNSQETNFRKTWTLFPPPGEARRTLQSANTVTSAATGIKGLINRVHYVVCVCTITRHADFAMVLYIHHVTWLQSTQSNSVYALTNERPSLNRWSQLWEGLAALCADLLHQISPKSVAIYGKHGHKLITKVSIVWLSHKLLSGNSREFHENPTNGFVADTRTQVDGQTWSPFKALSFLLCKKPPNDLGYVRIAWQFGPFFLHPRIVTANNVQQTEQSTLLVGIIHIQSVPRSKHSPSQLYKPAS